MEFSTLIGKLVLSPEGERCGYVTQVYLDKNFTALSCLVCADGEEEEFILPESAVQGIGDAVVAGKARLTAPSGAPCPVGKPVYDENGVLLGTASALSGGGNGVLTVIGKNGKREFPVQRISVGEIVVVHAKKNPITKKPRAPKKPRAQKTVKETPAAPSRPESEPTEELVYHRNVLGKKVQKTVDGLAAEGERVTAEMLRRARESNRLLELTACVLTEK